MRLYSKLSDAELVALLKRDDRAAFTEIYKRYWEILLNTAYQRLKSKEAAEEIVQIVFINLFIRRAELEPKSTLEAYLKTAIKYKVIDSFRSQGIQNNYIENAILRYNEFPVQPDQEYEYKELREQIISAAEKLPKKCKEVFLMSRFDQLSNQEISDRTGISVSTVKKHIYKAQQTLNHDLHGHQLDILLVSLIFLFK